MNQRNRNVNQHAVAEFDEQVLFRLLVFFQQLHAAVSADAVGQMDDQVTFPQFQEAVDRPRFRLLPPRRPADFSASEQFVIAEDHHLVPHQPEPAFDPPHAQLDSIGHRNLGLGEQLRQPLPFPLVVTGNEHLFVTADNRRQLLNHLAFRPGEPLDRLDLQMARGLHAVGGEGGQRHRGELSRAGHRRLDAVQAARIVQAGQVVFPLVGQFRQLNQHDPAICRQRVEETLAGEIMAWMSVSVVRHLRSASHGRYQREVRFHQVFELALGLDVEAADRLDLVAEELDPQRIEGVRRKDVQDAAVHAELAGHLDRRRPLEAPLDQPSQERVEIDLLADAQRPGCRLPLRPAGDRLQQGRKTGDDHRRPIGTTQDAQHPQTSAEDGIGNVLLLRQRLPRREDERGFTGETGHVAREIIDFADSRQDDEQRRRRLLSQSSHGQRAR